MPARQPINVPERDPAKYDYTIRTVTGITYYDVDEDSPIWEYAHASLNSHETGLASIAEIADDIAYEYSDRFETVAQIRKLKATLSHNMSVSPDFERYCRKPGSTAWLWCLTGSTIGVPREDKKEARRIAAEAKARSGYQLRTKPSRGVGGTSETVAQPQSHLISPYAVAPLVSTDNDQAEHPYFPSLAWTGLL